MVKGNIATANLKKLLLLPVFKASHHVLQFALCANPGELSQQVWQSGEGLRNILIAQANHKKKCVPHSSPVARTGLFILTRCVRPLHDFQIQTQIHL